MFRAAHGCILALLVIPIGCAHDRSGVVARLPQPIESTRIHRPAPRADYTPAPRWQAPRVAPSPSAWQPARGLSNRWDAIVIHHSASAGGSAEHFDRHHRLANGWDELGYHFVIGNGNGSGDGEIEVGSRWHKQKHGAHCKTPDNHYNDHGIGICLVGDFRHSSPTPKQMASLVSLTRYLSHACRIPANRIVTHGGVTGRTICPGPRFLLGQLRYAVVETSASVMH